MERLEKVSKQVGGSSGSYEFTQNGRILTPEQRKFYQDNGYIVIKGLLQNEDFGKWSQRFIDYCEQKLDKPPGMTIVRDISLVKQGIKIKGQAGVTKIQDWQDDQILFSFCNYPALIPYLNDFIGDNVKSVHTMLINQPPNTGKTQRHPLHQDLAYFPFRPANQIVCAWAAMEDVNRENGGLVIYPGTHKGEFLEHGYPDWKQGVNQAYWGIQKMPPPDAPQVHPEMKAGDVVFFHPLIIHGSGVNQTQGFRQSISCHYASSDCKFVDIRGTFQQENAKEILEYAGKKFGIVGMDYNDIWRNKSRLISGKDIPDGI